MLIYNESLLLLTQSREQLASKVNVDHLETVDFLGHLDSEGYKDLQDLVQQDKLGKEENQEYQDLQDYLATRVSAIMCGLHNSKLTLVKSF